MKDNSIYPLAKGHMLKVFATLECPVCGDEMDHCDDEYDGGWHHDTYLCRHCRISVSYITPRKYGEYHSVPDSEKRYSIENF